MRWTDRDVLRVAYISGYAYYVLGALTVYYCMSN